MFEFIFLCLSVSLALNFILVFFLFHFRKKLKTKAPDATAQEVLSELLAGPAVFKIEVIEKDSLLYWRK